MNTLAKKIRRSEIVFDSNAYNDTSKRSGMILPLQPKEKNEKKHAGLADSKGSCLASWYRSNINADMRNYFENIFLAGKHYCIFLVENPWTTTLALLIGLGGWMIEFVEIYIFSDFKYLIYLVLMIAYDGYSGIKKVRFLHELDPAKNPAPSAKVFKDKTFSKIGYYITTLGALHGLAHFQVQNVEVTVFHAFEYAALVAMMAAEYWSVQENYAAIGKKTILLLGWDYLKAYLPAGTKKPEA
ncbi:hypothetical protein [Arundinibacter roseus]|uniref:Uncharacterized protein n=1 Tax=Arundinibacter roseus TaxID=2070510 RepID=A0A4R4K9G3_9BACT|nr:hypothetical protein [Arundinibacter roseus]TDB64424.1 hypothetical protein EZE20_12125 [Arundinibacter roseus]